MPLYEYSCFIQKIRDYASGGKRRDEAIVLAMADCEQEGLMTDFLREHGTEAVNMLFTEFNMEDALDVRYEEGQQFILKLMSAMLADGRTDELLKLQSDPTFLKDMLTYYHIETASES